MDWFNIIKNLDIDDDNVYPYDYTVDALPYETDVMVRQNGGPPIAYLYCAHLPLLIEKMKTAIIQDIYVNKSARGKGVSKKMYDMLLANLPIGVEFLSGTWQDESAKSFWKHMGFEIKDKRIHKRIK